MERPKQTARKSTGGMAPKKYLGTKVAPTTSGVKMPRFYRSRAVALREIAKYQELLKKAVAQLEKVRAVSEKCKNDLEAERAMSSILTTQLEFVNENISVIVEASFTEGFRDGLEAGKSMLKEKHPEIDISKFEVHDFPLPPEALKELEDLKKEFWLSYEKF